MSLENNFSHLPVLLQEVVDGLQWSQAGLIVGDFTLGFGGHLEALLTRYPAPRLAVGVDQDLFVLAIAKDRLKNFECVEFHHANFADFAKETSLTFDRITVDLGVSSLQLDDPDRGFSFRANGPLDMRMDPSRGIPASEWLMHCSEDELLQVLRVGEESRARWVAQRWMEFRRSQRARTTEEFVKCFGFELTSKNRLGKHPLTKVFQAIRMHINRELEVLEVLLENLPRLLNTSGRVAVITFHSLEDRVVKWGLRGRLSAVNKKVIIASEKELAENPRSRSAKLRVFEKAIPVEGKYAEV